MTEVFSLAYLTYAPLGPAEAVTLAARCGYDAIGVRAIPVMPGAAAQPLIGHPEIIRETMARVRDTGVRVFDVEIVRLLPDFKLEPLKPFLETCAALEAKAILVGCDDPDEARLVANYAAFCDAAAPYGLTADIEFMPWTTVPDARTALKIVRAAGRPNSGILVDTLHAARSRTSLADVAAIPTDLLHYAQVCDAPAAVPQTTEGLLRTARHERLLPGDGGIDIAGYMRALQRPVPISIELPNDKEIAARGVEAWAQASIDAARRALKDIRS